MQLNGFKIRLNLTTLFLKDTKSIFNNRKTEMTTLKHTVRINGEIYTDAQLQRYEYERTLHTLH